MAARECLAIAVQFQLRQCMRACATTVSRSSRRLPPCPRLGMGLDQQSHRSHTYIKNRPGKTWILVLFFCMYLSVFALYLLCFVYALCMYCKYFAECVCIDATKNISCRKYKQIHDYPFLALFLYDFAYNIIYMSYEISSDIRIL